MRDTHECIHTFQETYTSHFRKDAEVTDKAVFVDGSRFCSGGQYYSGYAIWYPERVYAVQHRLPGHYSAQRAEIEAVRTVLEIDKAENRSPLGIYSDC